MPSGFKFPVVPAAFFGIVLGLAGLAGAWRLAAVSWQLPPVIGETLAALAVLVWAKLTILYAGKWIFARAAAVGELAHPVQCCFVGLEGVATMLAAAMVLPYSHQAAWVLFILGAVWTLLFAVWRTGGLWFGERDPGTTTPVLYLPTVAGNFVMTAVASALGYADWAQLAFGAGLFSWLAMESVLIHRFLTGPTMPPALRPTLGVQLAPAPVCALAYTSFTATPDLFAHALIGYGLLQLLVLVRLLPWITRQPFAPSYWAFTFGATALATAPLRLMTHGDQGPIATLAPWLFGAANLIVGAAVVGTLWLLLRGALLPSAVPHSAQTAPSRP